MTRRDTARQNRLHHGDKRRHDHHRRDTISLILIAAPLSSRSPRYRVPEDAAVPVGELSSRDHANQMRKWKRRLSASNLRWFVGGVDFSLNEEPEGWDPAMWFPHLYGIGVTPDVTELRAQLAANVGRTETVRRPVMVVGRPWDGRPNAALYAFKGDFIRRVSCETERFDKHSGRISSCRNTSPQKLLVVQRQELWRHLDYIGLTSRNLRTPRAGLCASPSRHATLDLMVGYFPDFRGGFSKESSSYRTVNE